MQIILENMFENVLAKSAKFILRCLISLMAVSAIVGCAECDNKGKQVISEERSVPEKDSEMAEMEALANCISDFIKDNKEKPSITRLDLKEESVRGQRVREREDLWFIGEWTCHKYDSSYPESPGGRLVEGRIVEPSEHIWFLGKWTGQKDDWYFVASWSIGNVDVLVRIEKSEDGKYVVTDWGVMMID